MMKVNTFIISFFTLLSLVSTEQGPYLPSWDSLDSRPLPSWYDEAKIGIFIHWGVFSVPSFRSEWFWNYWKEARFVDVVQFMKTNYPPNFTYQDFAREFTAEFYDPKQWAQLFHDAGAKYVVLTTKHHEGYTLWPSKTSFGWNAWDVGPRIDLVGDLAEAVKSSSDLRFGIYHSLFEWYNPLWLQDDAGNFSSRTYAEWKALPELYDLVNRYKPDIIWSDGEANAPDTYWGSEEFLAWLYNESPVKETVVVNDRWGFGTSCKHGGFYNCADRFSPGTLQPHKWENALTIDRNSWGYRRNAVLADYMTIQEILVELVKTVSCGGNVLINIGPTKEGIITSIYEERLRQLGTWLSLNGEAIYGTKPWSYQNDTLNGNVWYTQKEETVYGIVLEWPQRQVLAVQAPQFGPNSTIQLLTYDGELAFDTVENITLIQFPDRFNVKSEWAYVAYGIHEYVERKHAFQRFFCLLFVADDIRDRLDTIRSLTKNSLCYYWFNYPDEIKTNTFLPPLRIYTTLGFFRNRPAAKKLKNEC